MTTTTTLPLKSLREIAGAAFDSELCSTTSPVLVLFHTPWCGRCRILEPSLARLARKWEGEVSIAKANLDQSPELAARYGIAGTPTLILFCGGAPIACFAGTIAPRQLEPQVRGLLADYAQPTGTAARRRSDRAKPPPLAGPGLAEAAMRTRGPNMKVIGLIGGMSWESTIEYYRLINEAVRERLGGLHSAKCVLDSVDFAEVEALQRQGRWRDAARLLAAAGQNVENAGADLALICTNTMHKLADTVQASIGIPLLHIADATAEKVRQARFQRVGLLGTRFTMEEDFYRGRLADRHGLEVMIPNPEERQVLHRVIYEELCVGAIRPESRALIASTINRLVQTGAEAIILGCTELGLLLHDEDSRVPLFDTTRIHALAAVDYALKGNAS